MLSCHVPGLPFWPEPVSVSSSLSMISPPSLCIWWSCTWDYSLYKQTKKKPHPPSRLHDWRLPQGAGWFWSYHIICAAVISSKANNQDQTTARNKEGGHARLKQSPQLQKFTPRAVLVEVKRIVQRWWMDDNGGRWGWVGGGEFSNDCGPID